MSADPKLDVSEALRSKLKQIGGWRGIQKIRQALLDELARSREAEGSQSDPTRRKPQ
jgi:hypothetical protein